MPLTNRVSRRVVSIAALSLFLSTALNVSAQNVPMQIGSEQLRQLLEENAVLIDVRRIDEWQRTGVVESSHMVTFFDQRGNYDAAAWLGKINEFSAPDDPIVLICQTGSRSGVIANWLAGRMGYSAVYNLQPGIVEWIRTGLPVTSVN